MIPFVVAFLTAVAMHQWNAPMWQVIVAFLLSWGILEYLETM